MSTRWKISEPCPPKSPPIGSGCAASTDRCQTLQQRIALLQLGAFFLHLLLSCAVVNFVTNVYADDLSAGTTVSKTNVAETGQTSVQKTPKKELFRGKVVLVREALQRRGLKVGNEMKGQVVLETPDGTLIPIAADWRGRAFYQDARLRNRTVELVGFRRPGVPYLQILVVYTFDEKGTRLETDYWCETCAIPLYELKICECCQEPTRLRFRPADLPDYLNTSDETDRVGNK